MHSIVLSIVEKIVESSEYFNMFIIVICEMKTYYEQVYVRKRNLESPGKI